MTSVFNTHNEAFEYAHKKALELGRDMGIEKRNEYGKVVWSVCHLPFLDKSFGFELKIERVRPTAVGY